MRYAPYTSDSQAIAAMNEGQLLEYFLTRVFETEEVWGLDDGCEWVTRVRGGQSVMPLWPYQQLAESALDPLDTAVTPAAESLEDFMYQTLPALMEDDICLEIMPGTTQPGCVIAPHRLYDIFTGMFDAGEYKLDS